MANLFLRKRPVSTVFSLLEDKENHISYSIAWGLSQSTQFLKHFIKEVTNHTIDPERVTITLQEHETKGGITDIEVKLEGEIHLIVEAKRGWNLPSKIQIQQHADRLSFRESKAPNRFLLTLSECSAEYAARNLEATEINGIPVIHVSWHQITTCARNAYKNGSHAEKGLLSDLISYLEGLMTTQKLDSNLVFVVSLGPGTPDGWKISWIDIVKKRMRYFHPAAKNWPQAPPNYIAFRYAGKLQSIHHIESYEIISDLHDGIPEIPKDQNAEKTFLYKLGKPFAPDHDVPRGNIFPNGRVWCMLDTLFTSPTIANARDVTQQRERSTQS
jgi:hypothetical protein